MPHTRGLSLEQAKPGLLQAIQSGDRKPWKSIGCAQASFFRWLQKDTQLNKAWYGTKIAVTSGEARKFFPEKHPVQQKPPATPKSFAPKKEDPPIVKSRIIRQKANPVQNSGFFSRQTIVVRAEFCSNESGAGICKIQNRFANLRDDSHAETKYSEWLGSLKSRYEKQGTVSGRGWQWLDNTPPKNSKNSNQVSWSR